MSYTDELFDNNFRFISSFISLKQKIYALTFGGRLLLGGGGGRLLSEYSTNALTFGWRLLSGGAYYRKFTVSMYLSVYLSIYLSIYHVTDF